jgi:bis(5'-nucleosyl)-tetraphosphatase (symmetrical)
MVYLLGDVQGCAKALEQMLAKLAFSPSRDRLVVLGDLVNRGPGSLAVLRRLAGFGEAAVCLLGNHDLHLIAVAQGHRGLKAGDTLQDVLKAPDAAGWIDWLRHQRMAHVEAGWLCVHAGVVPQWDTAQTLALAAEVQALLRSPALPNFLAQMYGNEPTAWRDDLQGTARLRFIINTLTRIRFCSDSGELDLKTKEGAQAVVPGFRPWFDVPNRRTRDQPMAFGHWSALGLVNRPHLLALDTGCVWGGQLSAMRVDGGRRDLIQVPCLREESAQAEPSAPNSSH